MDINNNNDEAWKARKRWMEPNDETFYQDQDLTPAEFKQSLTHHRKLAKEMTHGQVLEMASENKSLVSNPVYQAMQERLSELSLQLRKQTHLNEFGEVIEQEKEFQSELKAHKKRLSNGQPSTRPQRDLNHLKQRKRNEY